MGRAEFRADVMRHFCTYFDHRYLPRGLALYHSLHRHCPAFQLWVLCLDSACYDILAKLALKNMRPIAREEVERDDEGLRAARENRSLIEYYFTCTPSLPLFVLKQQPDVDRVTYLDADLFFFANPQPLFDETAGHSIAIIAHRFPPAFRHFEEYGIYNVGWISFRRDDRALGCLRWWRARCLEWCHDRVEAKRFADQKYLDDWPERFPGVVVLQHKGANLASWNLANYRLRQFEGRVCVDEQPLIFFHFHHLKQLRSWLFQTDFAEHRVRPDRILRRSIFAPYFQTLAETIRQTAPFLPAVADPIRNSLKTPPAESNLPLERRLKNRIKALLQTRADFVAGKYLVVVNGHVL